MDDDVIENFVDESYENRIPIVTLGARYTRAFRLRSCLRHLSPSSSSSGNSECRSSSSQITERSAGQTIRSELTNDNIGVDPSTDQHSDSYYPEYFERLTVTASCIGIYIDLDD
jgi:hypothetical protein